MNSFEKYLDRFEAVSRASHYFTVLENGFGTKFNLIVTGDDKNTIRGKRLSFTVEVLPFGSELPVKQQLHFFQFVLADGVIGRCPLNGINEIVISYLTKNDGGVGVLVKNRFDIISPHVRPFNKLHIGSTLF
ncbi:hypothetical protein [Peribacillus sp. NPDC097295]|uniref:hypothetical protein n=1 Tax=Peribacillus sp. NPDC097295 TaxID=3364402 RepID=UPI0037FECAA3